MTQTKQNTKQADTIIYTDGASRGNPGLGGWAAIIITPLQTDEISGGQKVATNNQMELMAVEQALTFLQQKELSGEYSAKDIGQIIVHADSNYVLNGLQSWVDGWVRNGWMTSAKKPVENKSQWQALLALRDYFGPRLELVKVAGHSGHLYNDRCDALAVDAALSIGEKRGAAGGTAGVVKSATSRSAKKEPVIPFSGDTSSYESFLRIMAGDSDVYSKSNHTSTYKKESQKNGTTGAASKNTSEKSTAKKSSSAKPYSYVSFVNGVAYTDSTWAACEKRVKGIKNAKYKKVFSQAEEQSLIQDYTLSSLL